MQIKQVKEKAEAISRIAFSLYMNETSKDKFDRDLEQLKIAVADIQTLIPGVKFEGYQD